MSKLLALFVTILLIQLSSSELIIPNGPKAPVNTEPLNDVGDALILTPYIEGGLLDEAKAAAKVEFDAFQNVTSYSGYLTVDAEANANLFFWFFPSEGSQDDPVCLWLNGGPGSSSMYGLFVEHGPFEVYGENVTLRDLSWNKNQSFLYIDQPVGTGFSFTNGSYVTNQTQVGEHLYIALIQFFTLFSEYQENDFYITGESYAGKYVPAAAYAIYQNNPTANLTINLQGLIIVDGLTDPLHQFNYGDLLYQTGMIDLNIYRLYQSQQQAMLDNIGTGNYTAATDIWQLLVVGYYQNNTGIQNYYNYLQDVDDSPTDWQTYVNLDEVKQALHAGNRTYQRRNLDVYNALWDDITKSVALWMAELLSYYRVLLINGQLDVIVGYPLTENYLQNLNFSSAAEYATAPRSIWTVNDTVAGYVKVAGNLTEVMVRNAGHVVPRDKPELALELVSKFVRNSTIV